MNICKIFLGLFVLLSIGSQAAVTYVHTDHLGSVVAESNQSGQVTKRFHYKPFGETIETQQDDVGYTGHKHDADLGLTYMQARYYDPVLGRFYGNDPVGYVYSNPVMSFNRYSYVSNNPYRYTDPTGMYQDFQFRLQSQIGEVASGNATVADFQETLNYENEGTLIAASIATSGGLGAGLAVNSVRGMSTATKGKIGEAVARVGIAARGEKVIAAQERAGSVINGVSGRGAKAVPDYVVKDAKGNVKVVEAKFGSSNLTGAQKDLKNQMGDAFIVSRTTYNDVANAGAATGAAAGAVASCVVATSDPCRD